MKKKSIAVILAERIVEYCLPAIQAYADEKAVSIFKSGNDNKLCAEKHEAAKQFITDLTSCFVENDTNSDDEAKIAMRQELRAKKNMKKVLRQMIHPHISALRQRREKQKLMVGSRMLDIQRAESALSSTPMTPLYLKRKDTMPSPNTEDSGLDLSEPRDATDILRSLREHILDEIYEVRDLRIQYKGFHAKEHPAGSYDGLLQVVYENIGFAIIKARKYGFSLKSNYDTDGREQILLNSILLMCKIDFDRRIQHNGLIWASQKKKFSAHSGLMVEHIILIDEIDLRINDLLNSLFLNNIIYIDDWVNRSIVVLYGTLKLILEQLRRICKIPGKVIKDMQSIMQNLRASYISHDLDEFERSLEVFMQHAYENRPIKLPPLPNMKNYHRSERLGSEDLDKRTSFTDSNTIPPTPATIVLVV